MATQSGKGTGSSAPKPARRSCNTIAPRLPASGVSSVARGPRSSGSRNSKVRPPESHQPRAYSPSTTRRPRRPIPTRPTYR